MKINASILFAVVAMITLPFFSVSCGDDSFQLPTNIYTINKVYDVGNNGNATDMRLHVSFSAPNLSDIVEARLVVTKSSNTFSLENIDALSPSNFYPLSVSNTADQIIKPSSSFMDSDGDPIINGNYKAYVATIGIKNSKQLSSAKEFTLSDSPIFAGDYIGTWEDLGPPGPAKFPMSLRIADDYTGQMFYANSNFKPFKNGPQDAIVTMTVSGATVSAFQLKQFIAGYMGGCSASSTLSGKFEDDINLILDTFQWDDCDGSREVVLKFTRQ